MQHLKLILVLFLLLTGGGTHYLFSSEMLQDHSNKETVSLLSDDLQKLSPSHISTSVYFSSERINSTLSAAISEGNCREFSRDKAYLANHRFIHPGLSQPDIIFPFHTFL